MRAEPTGIEPVTSCVQIASTNSRFGFRKPFRGGCPTLADRRFPAHFGAFGHRSRVVPSGLLQYLDLGYAVTCGHLPCAERQRQLGQPEACVLLVAVGALSAPRRPIGSASISAASRRQMRVLLEVGDRVDLGLLQYDRLG
jgi:hypothetical protein